MATKESVEKLTTMVVDIICVSKLRPNPLIFFHPKSSEIVRGFPEKNLQVLARKIGVTPSNHSSASLYNAVLDQIEIMQAHEADPRKNPAPQKVPFSQATKDAYDAEVDAATRYASDGGERSITTTTKARCYRRC